MAPRPLLSRPLHPARSRSLRSSLRQAVRDAGLTDLSHAAEAVGGAGEPFWEIEPQPLVIDSAEWTLLEAALRQRARFVNAFLVDLYARQEVLKQRLLPPEVVLADPYYRRPCLGLEPHRQNPATLLRFDLIKTGTGWMFTATHANTPVGLSYAVQTRRFMTQEGADLYRSLPDYQGTINFPLQVLNALHQLAPNTARAPSIVVLTGGPRDPFYSEHSFLARKMGLPLARGDDLIVLDNSVYLKTIAGLERVDVIYRRLNDAHIDPVVFSTDRERAGIPGLIQCIRRGTVVLANAIGTGVAESRALDAALTRLMRFYFGEAPLLPSLPTYTCGDTDQLDFIMDHRDSLVIRPVHERRLADPRPPLRTEDLLGPHGLGQLVRESPHEFVAQRRIEPLAVAPGQRKSPPFRLSAFVLSNGRQFDVFPGGLVRLGAGDPPAQRVGTTADAIVLASTDTGAGAVADLEATVASGVSITTLGSRPAEHLFWLGRYLERAESTARMAAILDDVALEEIPARDRRRWLPVWRGLLEATGQVHEKITARAKPEATLSSDLSWRMTLDADNPGSIYSSVSAACDNARQLRDYVSPEVWTILTRMLGRLDTLRSPRRNRGGNQRRAARPAAAEAIALVINDVNALLATAERTLLHDAGWHFLRMGLHLERGIMTCSALRHVIGSHDAAPVSVTASMIYRDNPELSALLRMLGSQDAYRRLYQTRSQPRFVAQLFLQQSEAPRSIFYNLHHMRMSLHAIQRGTERIPTAPAQGVADILHFLGSLRLDQHFGEREATGAEDRQSLDELLADLLSRLYQLHPLLSDLYFSHQARLTPADRQAELTL
jgi:uncharacterized circularly permuted ATP-grasp superfamily protein/uncharacterized alpha-E superfamily protein